jgi:Domain of unknown function (DUF1707)
MSGPWDVRAARRASHSRMRASHADRDQVVDTLKDAFVDGRLTRDEFDSRVGDALASLTADLPAIPPTARPARKPARTRPADPTVKNGRRVIATTTMLFGGVWVAGTLLSQTDNQALAGLVFALIFIWFGIVVLVGSTMIESRHHRRADRQLPPASRDRGQPAAL